MRRIEDPVFGWLVFNDTPRPYWEGGGVFPTTGERIEWFVAGGDEGPGEGQRAVFKAIAERFPALRRDVDPFLAPIHGQLCLDPEDLDHHRDLPLSSLSVPERESPDMEWELTINCRRGRGGWMPVQMRGWKPTGDIDWAT